MNLWVRLGLYLASRVAKQWERKLGRQWRGWGGGKGGCRLEIADAEGWTFNNHWGWLVTRGKKIGVEKWEGIVDFLCLFMRLPGYHRIHCENMYFTVLELHTDEGIETLGARHPSSCTDISNTGYTCGKCHSLFLLWRGRGVQFSEPGLMFIQFLMILNLPRKCRWYGKHPLLMKELKCYCRSRGLILLGWAEWSCEMSQDINSESRLVDLNLS